MENFNFAVEMVNVVATLAVVFAIMRIYKIVAQLAKVLEELRAIQIAVRSADAKLKRIVEGQN